MLAYKALRPTSYIEFHHDWEFTFDDETGNVEAKEKVTIASQAAFVDGYGRMRFGRWGRHVVNVRFGDATSVMNRQNMMILTFRGQTDLNLNEFPAGKFKFVVRLSDGAGKTMKGKLHFRPSSEDDKSDSPTE